MKYCPYCHSKLYENDDYCLNCGRMLRKKKTTSGSFDHISPSIKPKEFDTARMTPKVKLADYTHIEQYSSKSSVDKLMNNWLIGHNWRSTKMTDNEMNELNKIAKSQNMKVGLAIVVIVIIILLIRAINLVM